jgi:hypothetical protein
MYALAICKYRLIADPAALHHRLVPVTTSAGLGDVGAIDRRFRIARRQDRRHVAIFGVAIQTSSRLGSILLRLRMKAVVVSAVRLVVKERTCQIRKLLSWSVTALALELWRTGG